MHGVVPHLHQGTDHAKAGQSEVLKRPGLALRVQKRVEEQRNVRWRRRYMQTGLDNEAAMVSAMMRHEPCKNIDLVS